MSDQGGAGKLGSCQADHMETRERPEEGCGKMHWRDRWDMEARREARALQALPEGELLERIERGSLGHYYQVWHTIGAKGTISQSAMVLWAFLCRHPGEEYVLHRYHCAAALFQILGVPDPDCGYELRKRVQWDYDGEAARQDALLELKERIQEQLDGLGEPR